MVGETACCIFIQVKYHQLRPDYLFGRIKELPEQLAAAGAGYIDTDRAEPKKALLEVSRSCTATLLLAWSWAKAARYVRSTSTKGGSIQRRSTRPTI